MTRLFLLCITGTFAWWTTTTASLQAAVDPRCGSYCLYVALKALEASVPDFEQFDAALGTPPAGGYSLQELADAAGKYNIHSLGVETSLENLRLRSQRFACIALLREGHFVLISDFNDSQVTIIDPPDIKTIPASTVSTAWDGKALLLSPEPLAAEEDLPRPASTNWPFALVVGAVVAAAAFAGKRMFWSSKAAAMLSAALVLPLSGCGSEGPPSGPTVDRAAAPALALKQAGYDLGNLPVSRVRHVIQIPFRNRGTAPLEISRVMTTCGCAGLGEYPRLLPPGDGAWLSLGLDCSMTGPRSASIVIDSNDRTQRRMRIPITWTPKGRFVVRPEAIELGTILPQSVHERTVAMIPNAGLRFNDPPVIRKIVCLPEGLVTCEARPAATGFDLAIRVQASEKAESIHGGVSVEMTDAELPEVQIPIRARVSPPVYAEPESLFLGSGNSGELSKGRVIVCSSGNEPIKIVKVETSQSLPGLTTSFSELTPSRIAITVTFPRKDGLGVQRDVLKIEVDSPQVQTLEVPILAVTRKAGES